jgi:hypothetical protein
LESLLLVVAALNNQFITGDGLDRPVNVVDPFFEGRVVGPKFPDAGGLQDDQGQAQDG